MDWYCKLTGREKIRKAVVCCWMCSAMINCCLPLSQANNIIERHAPAASFGTLSRNGPPLIAMDDGAIKRDWISVDWVSFWIDGDYFSVDWPHDLCADRQRTHCIAAALPATRDWISVDWVSFWIDVVYFSIDWPHDLGARTDEQTFRLQDVMPSTPWFIEQTAESSNKIFLTRMMRRRSATTS